MAQRFFIPLNEEGDSTTMDILTVSGTKKKKKKQWRKYLAVRCGISDYHTCSRIAKELGFDELV